MFGRRGITHSIAFAGLVGWIASTLFSPGVQISRLRLALYFAAVTVSHPLLDMLTNGGLGVALLAPFSAERFFFPWRPIEVSPIGFGFFSERGLAVLASEIIWIWVPSILIVAISLLLGRKRS
jgi:inner membrane protein